MLRTLSGLLLLVTTATLGVASAAAQLVPAGNSRPQPVPLPAPVATPRDTPYPGTIALDVDMTDTQRGIATIHETIPVAASGDIVLLYPRWIPGNHAPSGALANVAGLRFRANGVDLRWTRDPVNLFAVHVDVPVGTRSVEASFQFLSSTVPGASFTSPDILRLQWISTSLYPAGYFVRDVPIAATATYPAGFTAVSGLPSTRAGSAYRYQTTSYDILLDSPVVAGRYYRAWPLSDRVTLDTFADKPEDLAATPAQIDAHRRLVDQAVKLFGAQHYDNYHFLFSISDQVAGSGLEHHRSSEDGTKAGYFTKWDEQIPARNLLPHEYAHSWDGKFRRGADLWSPNYDVPMRPGLLWVYEGGTQFFGYLLQARSGLVSKEDTLEQYASIMAQLDTAPGRQWRSLVDTTYDEAINGRRGKPFASWQRTEDYYNEGLLIWMEVDSLLREKSGGTKSIDDFARAFYGIRDGDYGELTYTIDDVAAALNGVVPYDWKGFLVRRTTELADHAPLQGFARNGYALGYTDQPSKVFTQGEKARKQVDLTYSLGMTVDPAGMVTGVLWDGPAFKAGLSVGAQIVAVGDMAFSDDRLRAAVSAAKGAGPAVSLLLKSGDRLHTVGIDYHDGLRYPHLRKVGTGETGLDRLLAPR